MEKLMQEYYIIMQSGRSAGEIILSIDPFWGDCRVLMISYDTFSVVYEACFSNLDDARKTCAQLMQEYSE